MLKERTQYDRVYELLDFINRLTSSAEGLTYDDLKMEFGWQRRTAERMVTLVSQLFPTAFTKRVEGRKAYFKLERQSIMPPNFITEQEVAAVKTAASCFATHGDLPQILQTLYNKLVAQGRQLIASEDNLEQLAIIGGMASAPRPRTKTDLKIFNKLQEAIITFRKIKIQYRHLTDKKIVPSVVCPLGFLYGKMNYLVSMVEGCLADPYRLYIMHQIADVEILKEPFDAKGFNINDYAAKSFGVFQRGGVTYEIKWLAEPEVAEQARFYEFHPTQKLTDQPDGSLLIEFTADGLKEMAYYLFTWEGKIKILAPKELKEEYNSILKKLK